ncbi:pyridoxal phosphate-dependent decarboxylase family protein [Phycicoccus flavus]|uniref:pyridoxal phosphate-dependent decarboxylase family protein n=1 Tax=Phycicoccus flavus TaxID=2502783 RepID=UPI000FEBD96D|nr:aminotransferase class V-fold PLP-dependent enzyme [Phycicoccus flavus]NHA66538.1 aminotransferase class V-fold PLP-dependent enzyme [Phycicoccus flavus]
MTDHAPAPVATGPSADEVRAALEALRVHDLPTHGGRTLAYVYDSGLADVDTLGRDALAMYGPTNGLDPTAFPSLLQMENDLVAEAGHLLDAPDGFVGSVTSGGTESVVLAVLAARDGAPHVTTPSMVIPSSAHAAFLKAAHLLGVRAVVVDVDPTTLRADPEAMRAAVDGTTVLLAASAPSYAHGVVDPVAEIAAVAAERGIRCHVDACIGGWVLPHLDDVPSWTFAVDGVTSVSVDLHKYAYAPKGVSLLLHRDAVLRRGHFFASADWPGYTMLNSTLQSTKSGGPLAAAWAVVRHIGRDGYAHLARQARAATLDLAGAAAGIEGLAVVAAPDASLLALTTDASCDVYTVADEMLARGWYVQPQMAFRDLPPTLHLTLSAATAPSVPAFLDDLRAAVAAARAAGPVQVDPALAGMLGSLDAGHLDDATFGRLLAAAGLAGEDGALALPQRMAPVNALLDACPPALREAILLGVLDRLSRPSAPAGTTSAP